MLETPHPQEAETAKGNQEIFRNVAWLGVVMSLKAGTKRFLRRWAIKVELHDRKFLLGKCDFPNSTHDDIEVKTFRTRDQARQWHSVFRSEMPEAKVSVVSVRVTIEEA